MTKRIYLAHPISTTGEFDDSKRVANELRALGYEVYVASENDSINDKSNDPTPLDIYEGDITEILKADIFVVNVTGGLQSGTDSEVGFVSGLNEASSATMRAGALNKPEMTFYRLLNRHPDNAIIPIYGYTSNARLLQPQYSDGMASASINHLVKGMIDRWGRWLGDEHAMLAYLKEVIND